MMFVLIRLHDVLGTSEGKKTFQLTVKSTNISKVKLKLFVLIVKIEISESIK